MTQELPKMCSKSWKETVDAKSTWHPQMQIQIGSLGSLAWITHIQPTSLNKHPEIRNKIQLKLPQKDTLRK